MFFVIISISICLFYCCLILAFYYGWKQIKPFTTTRANSGTFVSVIIAVRNEETNIENLLNDIILQDYPKEKFEVIVVDDSSEDSTAAIVKRFANRQPCLPAGRLPIVNRQPLTANTRIFFYSLPSCVSGKKAAVSYALKKTKGSLIITTDGDCRMDEKWLSSIVSFYEIYKPKMIIAPVFFYHEKNIFEKLQSLEFSSLVATGAGAVGINRPIICNAANLAYERNIISEKDEFLNNSFASGDDVFLLHNLKKTNRENIMFLKSLDAVVYTKPQPDLSSFISQRIRWSAKSKGYIDKDSLLTVLLTFFMNLTMLIIFIAGFFNCYYFILFGLLFSLKTIDEFFFLQSFLTFYKKQKLLIWFVPLQLIYFVYVSFIGIFGLFVKVTWKDRKI